MRLEEILREFVQRGLAAQEAADDVIAATEPLALLSLAAEELERRGALLGELRRLHAPDALATAPAPAPAPAEASTAARCRHDFVASESRGENPPTCSKCQAPKGANGRPRKQTVLAATGGTP